MPATLLAINYGLNQDFGRVSSASMIPSIYYIGLSTTALTQSDTSGSAATEPSGGGYARVPFTNNKTNWTTSTNGSLVNAVSASFAQSTAAWGTIVSLFLASASTSGSGNIWYYYTLSPSIPIVSGTEITFAAGTITASRD